MIAMNAKNIRFKPGRVLATPGAIEALERSGQNLWHYLSLHLSGNWGVVDDEDKAANEEALKEGSRLLSAYLLDDADQTKIWVLTEAVGDDGQRASTLALLPDEY